MYLPFGKSWNKLLNVKCITLNSPLILRMNSIKLINTFKIIQILTLLSKTKYTKISKANTQVLFLHNFNISKYKTKLQMTYWITHLIKN